MHFWIDKRSQQCGFGRSRVAASLSGTGGSGFGFGHPPRRIHSNKTVNTTSYNSTVPIHRQQQLNVDYQRNANYSANSSSSSHYHSNINNNNNNNGLGHHVSTSSAQTFCSNNYNNNINNNLQINNEAEQSCNNNINNNSSINTNITRSSTLRGEINRNAINAMRTVSSLQDNTLNCDLRNYFHPQFGNMSVRHFQPATSANNPIRQMDSRAFSSYNSVSTNSNGHQQLPHHQHQTSQSALNGGTEIIRQSLRSNDSDVSQNMTNLRASTNQSSSLPIQHHCHPHNQHSTALNSMDSVDNQLLPAHLKCGMCASLVLASVFVAGAKFYFDHQGTGLEVLIFCAFCATFFLAACTVSLCRVPKGLLPQRQSQQPQQRPIMNQQRNNHGANCNLHDHNSSTLNDTPNSDEIVRSTDLNELQQRTFVNVVSASGPPPYHIAILLPEVKNFEKVVTSSSLSIEESPPPSYDKIAV